MNKNLVNKVGSVGQDNLIAKLEPAAQTFGVILEKGAAEAALVRGTVLGLKSNGKMVIYAGAEGTVPAAVLADDVTVGTAADATGVAYRCGNFNRAALTVGSSYTLTAADEDALRKYNIILTDVM